MIFPIDFKRLFFGALFFPILCLLLHGCGYSISQGKNPSVPLWMEKVYVEPWTNRTNEIRLSSLITDEIRHRFIMSNTFRLVRKEDADVVLSGEVRSVRNTGLSYVRYDQTIEREVIVECAVKMIEKKTGRVIWESSNITRSQSYLVGRELMETEGLKDETLKKVSRYMAEVIYHRVAEVF